ncbi:MAG: sel1 repeat family protein [Gammaproteobacteria bacterium]|nr:sel1 repeat family protein [Gammaproteobacteria bacterium]
MYIFYYPMKKLPLKNRMYLEHGCDLYEGGKLHEAFLAFHRAAKLGNPEAQVNLGNLYDAGQGVEQDRKRAAYWYKRAIKKEIPEAAYNLAISYKQQGKIRWAQFWFKRASEMGDEDAMNELTLTKQAK